MTPVPAASARPPLAARRPQPREHHGDVFVDPYEWLRAKDDPEVLAYLEAENAYTAATTAHLEPLVQTLFDELRERTQETDLSVPTFRRHTDGRAYWYYLRTQEGAEYARYCRAPADDAGHPPSLEDAIPGEVTYLDGNAEAAGHEYFDLGALTVSPAGGLLAYSVDVTGAERFTLRVRDLASGSDLPDQIVDVSSGATWAGDSHLFYARADEAWRPYVVLRHRLGTDAEADAEVLTEPDERFWLDVDRSRDDRWLVFSTLR